MNLKPADSEKLRRAQEEREERWRKLGYERPSIEERKANLNKILARLSFDEEDNLSGF